jgi:hypothetical protein
MDLHSSLVAEEAFDRKSDFFLADLSGVDDFVKWRKNETHC